MNDWVVKMMMRALEKNAIDISTVSKVVSRQMKSIKSIKKSQLLTSLTVGLLFVNFVNMSQEQTALKKKVKELDREIAYLTHDEDFTEV